MKWYKIKLKFTGKCITCNNYVHKGEEGFWAKEIGIKHIQCFDMKIIHCIICNKDVSCISCTFNNYCDMKVISQCMCKECLSNKSLNDYKNALQNIKI